VRRILFRTGFLFQRCRCKDYFLLHRVCAIILTPIYGEPNLRMKDGVLVFSGTPLEDLGEALTKHREERLKTIRKTHENLI
jgi:hypothetical protein